MGRRVVFRSEGSKLAALPPTMVYKQCLKRASILPPRCPIGSSGRFSARGIEARPAPADEGKSPFAALKGGRASSPAQKSSEAPSEISQDWFRSRGAQGLDLPFLVRRPKRGPCLEPGTSNGVPRRPLKYSRIGFDLYKFLLHLGKRSN